MKKATLALLFALVSSVLCAQEPAGKAERDYAGMLQHGAFSCKLKSGLYDAAMSYQSPKQDMARDELMSCIREYADQARSGLPIAVKAAKSEQVKSALKNLYTEWSAYFGKFDSVSESRYERADSALRTELLTEG